MRRLNRRDFIGTTGMGGVLASAMPSDLFLTVFGKGRAIGYEELDPRNASNFIHPLRLPSDNGLLAMLRPSGNVTLTAKEVTFEPFPGTTTKLWAYEAVEGGRTYQNPILMLNKGQRFDATLRNELSEMTIIHWHGLIVDWKNDGHPSYAIEPGGSYQYGYTVANRAGTYWYHPHSHGSTGKQVNAGLASLFLVDDEAELSLRNALDLSIGTTDIPLIIQDKRFSDGAFTYDPADSDLVAGFIGDVMLTNLTVNPVMDVSSRVYRFRVLNGSNSRTYRLAVSRGSERIPFHVIGADGGLLDQPYQVDEVFLAAAERVDLLLDLRRFQAGDTLFLQSIYFDAMHNEHGGHGDVPQNTSLAEGAPFYILKLNVTRSTSYDREIPRRLSEISPADMRGASTRPFSFVAPDFIHDADTKWRINGWTFNMDEYPVSLKKNTVEIWEMNNDQGSMPHPMHIHGFQFRVLERLRSPDQIRPLAVDANGLLPTDMGWKDTVSVWPGETVRVAVDFSHSFSGEQTYLYHCHILEHADLGMMINYKIIT
ncbi:MAG: multicopper oxidase domain-containing protein [Acidobacteria bacterium]|nr:multicopper oxidase domain-containing protein [Acidobacteriota bacterium]